MTTFETIDLAALDTVTGGDGEDAGPGASAAPQLPQPTGGHDSMTLGGYAKACAFGAVKGAAIGGIGGALVGGGGAVPGAIGGAVLGCGRSLATHTLFGSSPAY